MNAYYRNKPTTVLTHICVVDGCEDWIPSRRMVCNYHYALCDKLCRPFQGMSEADIVLMKDSIKRNEQGQVSEMNAPGKSPPSDQLPHQCMMDGCETWIIQRYMLCQLHFLLCDKERRPFRGMSGMDVVRMKNNILRNEREFHKGQLT